jgi:hypothetical protein
MYLTLNPQFWLNISPPFVIIKKDNILEQRSNKPRYNFENSKNNPKYKPV